MTKSDTQIEKMVNALRARYRINFIDFFTQQLKIKTKEKGLVYFVPNVMQMKILSYIAWCIKNNKPIRIIILKARQIGLSTLSEGLLFWFCTMFKHVNGITMAHDKITSEKLFEMCKIFYANMNPAIRPMRRYSSKKELVFEKPERIKKGDPTSGISLGSQIQIQTAGNVHAGTGTTTHFLHLSEIGRYPFAQEMKASMFPSIPYKPLTFIIEESTAWGAGSEFYNDWENAKAGESNFQPFFFAWHDNPEYQLPLDEDEELVPDPEEIELIRLYHVTPEQLNWRRHMLKDYEPEKFMQEYPASEVEAWQTAGYKVFDTKILEDLRESLCNPRWVGRVDSGRLLPIYENHPEVMNYLSVWELPKKNQGIYDIGIDVSVGSEGGDFTVITVIERESKRVVALWKGLVDPFDAAVEAEKIGIFYNYAQINCEVNSIGYATNGKLAETYPNLYRWKIRDEQVLKLTRKTGYETTHRSKKYLVSLARTIMRLKPPIRSKWLWEEMTMYVDYGEDYFRAAPGFHDDCVQSYMLAIVAADDEKLPNYIDAETDEEEKVKAQAHQVDTWEPSEQVEDEKTLMDY